MRALQEPCLPSSRSFDVSIRHFKGQCRQVLGNEHAIARLLLKGNLDSKHWKRGIRQVAGIFHSDYRSWRRRKCSCVLPCPIGSRTPQDNRPRYPREHKSPETARGNNKRPLSPEGGGHSQQIVGGSRMV